MWKKWWLLFAVIWGVVAALQVGTILALSEEPEMALQPALLGLAVPAVLYLFGWLWERFRKDTFGTEGDERDYFACASRTSAESTVWRQALRSEAIAGQGAAWAACYGTSGSYSIRCPCRCSTIARRGRGCPWG